MVYLGHVAIWFLIWFFLTAVGVVKIKGGNVLFTWFIFAILFAIPSCTVQIVFGN